MNLSEKIKDLRLKNDMSQEQLAELLNVSRQSISKYEQGLSFPDYEKISIIAKKFNVSFDYLLGDNPVEETEIDKGIIKLSNNNNKISILDCTGKILSSYYKFTISRVFKPSKNEPKAALMGVDKHTFWGENAVLLAWYENEEDINQEIKEIYKAMANGEQSYELKYNTPIKSKGLFGIEIDTD